MFTSVTIEEAVALLINIDYVPAGFSVSDMTSAFLEEATAEYESAHIDRTSQSDLSALKSRKEVCSNRHQLGVALIDSISKELRRGEKSALVLEDDKSAVSRITLASLNDWTADQFGISLPNVHDKSTTNLHFDTDRPSNGPDSLPSDTKWEDIVIKIYDEYRIGWNANQGKWYQSSFREIGLMGVRKNDVNALGVLLVGMSMGKRFPSGRSPQPKDKTSISKLRNCLRTLTSLSSDPFLAFNEADGWKPRFSIVDDRRNAEERAKRKAVHVPLDAEAPDFEDEDDEAGRFLSGKD